MKTIAFLLFFAVNWQPIDTTLGRCMDSRSAFNQP